MPVHPFTQPRGELVSLSLDSSALRDNLLRDPHVRTALVYLPEGYHRGHERYFDRLQELWSLPATRKVFRVALALGVVLIVGDLVVPISTT